MKELRILTQDNVDAELMKEVNEFLEHNELSENQIKENTNNAIGIMRTRTKQVKLIDRTKPPTTETDLLVELENFKKEEKIYKFEIPLKYQMSKFEKCIKERKIKGRLVKFYENSVIDIINKNKTVKDVEGIPVHNGNGGRRFACLIENGYAFLPVSTTDGIYIYRTDIATAKAERGARVSTSFVGGFFKLP